MEYGDDFEDKILAAVRASQELLVLLTPWAIKRPYIWLEIGAIWGQGQRIVGVLYGLGVKELMTDEGTPALLKRITLVEINKLDEYFDAVREAFARSAPRFSFDARSSTAFRYLCASVAPKRLPSSTASLITTRYGISSRCSSS